MGKKSKDGLSKRQAGIIAFIKDYTEAHSRPPTIREIGNAVDISSTSVVNYNLNKLVEKGLIIRDPDVSRGIRLVNKGPLASAKRVAEKTGSMIEGGIAALNETVDRLIRIPLAGDIVASEPVEIGSMEGFYEDDAVEISASMLPDRVSRNSNLFALRVNGESMIDAMVNHGDLVVLQQQNEARNGDMVAVWIDDNTMTLKHYHPELDQNRIRLQPANPTMDPIYIHPSKVQVQGKVVLIVRQTA